MHHLRILTLVGPILTAAAACGTPEETDAKPDTSPCATCVGQNALVNDSVRTEHVLDGTLRGEDIADEALGPDKIVDGSGSGLVADLLDGVDASQLVRSDVDATFQGLLTADALTAAGSGGIGRLTLENGTGELATISFDASEVLTCDVAAPSGGHAWSVAGETRMSLSSDGHLAIQTAPSSAELHVNDPIAGAELRVTGGDGAYGAYLGADDNAPYVGTFTDHDLRFVIGGRERMRLDRSGRLGIGRQPGSELDVAGTLTADRLCLGGDCRSQWADEAGAGHVVVPDPTLPDQADPSVPGSIAWYIAAAAGDGVTVQLKPGNYPLQRSLVLDSRVTIMGSGWSSVLVQVAPTNGGSEEFPLLWWDGATSLEDLELRDFQLVGRSELVDSNCIHIEGRDAARNHEMVLSGLKVVGCSGQGVHVKGTTDLVLSDLVLLDNGTETLDHNLYLRRVSSVVVANVLSARASGDGFNGNTVDGLTMTGFIAAENGTRGIRFSSSNHVAISASEALRNGTDGFLFIDEDAIACRWIAVSGCVADDNGGSGIRISSGSEYAVSGCMLSNNAGWGADASGANREVITGSVFDGNVAGAVQSFAVQTANL